MDNEQVYSLHDKITPEFILTRVPETDIYQRYLGLEAEMGAKFCNPLRNDENPTCTFGLIKGKLVFRDWSEHIYMDVFDVVQRRFNVGFKKALNIIAADFELIDTENPSAPIFQMPKAPTKTLKPKFDVDVRPFSAQQLAYLQQFGITSKIAARFNVFNVDHLVVNGSTRYVHNSYDPALGYYFGLNSKGHQKWKIYFYTRTTNRFLCNTSRLNGWIQLRQAGPVVVITKSLKDVMTLYSLGISAVATQGESILLREATINELKRRFDHVVSLFDFDRAGIKTSALLRRNYGIPAYALTDGRAGSKDYASKDISDYVRDHGSDAAQKLVNYALDNLLHGTLTNVNYPKLSASL